MTVYVDSEYIRWQGKMWCHLVADSARELHAFAGSLGLRREWFQGCSMYPHYDVTAAMQQKALRLGARPADRRTIVECGRRMREELYADSRQRSRSLALVAR